MSWYSKLTTVAACSLGPGICTAKLLLVKSKKRKSKTNASGRQVLEQLLKIFAVYTTNEAFEAAVQKFKNDIAQSMYELDAKLSANGSFLAAQKKAKLQTKAWAWALNNATEEASVKLVYQLLKTNVNDVGAVLKHFLQKPVSDGVVDQLNDLIAMAARVRQPRPSQAKLKMTAAKMQRVFVNGKWKLVPTHMNKVKQVSVMNQEPIVEVVRGNEPVEVEQTADPTRQNEQAPPTQGESSPEQPTVPSGDEKPANYTPYILGGAALASAVVIALAIRSKKGA